MGHVVTYLCSPEGSLICTVFTKKCQNRTKRGYPLFLPVFGESCGHFGSPTPRMGPRRSFLPHGPHPHGVKTSLRAKISRCRVQSARQLGKIVYFRGGGAHLAPCSRCQNGIFTCKMTRKMALLGAEMAFLGTQF